LRLSLPVYGCFAESDNPMGLFSSLFGGGDSSSSSVVTTTQNTTTQADYGFTSTAQVGGLTAGSGSLAVGANSTNPIQAGEISGQVAGAGAMTVGSSAGGDVIYQPFTPEVARVVNNALVVAAEANATADKSLQNAAGLLKANYTSDLSQNMPIIIGGIAVIALAWIIFRKSGAPKEII